MKNKKKTLDKKICMEKNHVCETDPDRKGITFYYSSRFNFK